MNTLMNSLTVRIILLSIILTGLGGCKKTSDDEVWVETRNITVQAYKSDPENGKQYLDIIYENVGSDSYSKIKYQLIRRTGSTIDTTERIILPETVLEPKDKHLVPRHIGQSPATFDDVKVGKVWGVVDTKK